MRPVLRAQKGRTAPLRRQQAALPGRAEAVLPLFDAHFARVLGPHGPADDDAEVLRWEMGSEPILTPCSQPPARFPAPLPQALPSALVHCRWPPTRLAPRGSPRRQNKPVATAPLVAQPVSVPRVQFSCGASCARASICACLACNTPGYLRAMQGDRRVNGHIYPGSWPVALPAHL